MIVSDARREANRRNARLSTGPRTEPGKDQSRRNALSHGLSAAVVRLPEDEPAAPPGAGPDRASADPVDDWPGWLAEQVAVIASRLRRCDRLDRRHRARVAHRAEFQWDDDRRLEVEFLGSGLARDPAAVAGLLRMSPHGCDWMIGRWALLARAADREGCWTAEQRALAFALLGTPPEFRDGSPGEPLDPEGRPAPAGAADLAALARREVAALRRRKAEVAPADALDRSAARADPDVGDDPDLRKLRRHESDLHRRLRWCVAQLAKAPSPAPAPLPPPPPPRPEPAPQPADALGVDPVARFKSMMGWAEAKAEADAGAPELPVAATSRPDPRAALEKARQADRRRKRDRRRS